MKKVFEILPVDLDPHKCILFCEVSNEGFSYSIKDIDENRYVSVAVFHFDKAIAKDEAGILSEGLQGHSVLTGNFKKVHIIYSFPESVIIPFSLYSSHENDNVLDLIHGDLPGDTVTLTDIIAENGIYNTYRVPETIVNVLKYNFPYATNTHQYSILLKESAIAGDKIKLIFYPKKFVMYLKQDSVTRFVNTFSYDTAEDVSYILLNTCRQYEAENIPVEISGLIEENSTLYKEIYKYFSDVKLSILPAGCDYSEEIARHPPHYFSHIFAADLCE